MVLFQFYGGGNFGAFTQSLRYLESFGLLDAIIPFVLIFAVFYAVLDQINLFKNTRVNPVIALSISLLTVIPHVLGLYPPSNDVVVIMNRAAPEIALITFAIVLAMILTGLITGKQGTDVGFFKEKGHWIALILVALVFLGAMAPKGYLPGFIDWLADPFFYSIMIIILVFGLVIWLVVGNPGANKETSGGNGK